MRAFYFVVLVVVVWATQTLQNRQVLFNQPSAVFRTVITTRNVTKLGQSKAPYNEDEDMNSITGPHIHVRVYDKPHNLYIGRCTPDLEQLHNENVILNNDGKSQVAAVIRMNVDGPIDIRCVKASDERPGTGAYPTYLDGGVGYNFVEIGVTTRYGKGFHFFIQIFGFSKEVPKEMTTVKENKTTATTLSPRTSKKSRYSRHF